MAATGDLNSLFSLKWNNYEVHLTGGLKSLLTDEQFADVTLACEGHYIRAHKLVLSLCSPYFKRLFEIHRRDRLGTIVILNHVKFKDLERLLSFAYTGQVQVPQSELSSFLKTGELLQIVGLEPARNSQQGSNASPNVTPNSDSRRAARLSDVGRLEGSPTALLAAKQSAFTTTPVSAAGGFIDEGVGSSGGFRVGSTARSPSSDVEDSMGQNSSGLHGDFDETERTGFEGLHQGESIGIDDEDPQDDEEAIDAAAMMQYQMDEGNIYDDGTEENTATSLPGPSRMLKNDDGWSTSLGFPSFKSGGIKRRRVSDIGLGNEASKRLQSSLSPGSLQRFLNSSASVASSFPSGLSSDDDPPGFFGLSQFMNMSMPSDLDDGGRVTCPNCNRTYKNKATLSVHKSRDCKNYAKPRM